MHDKIALSVLTGFLGAGKTTLLRRMLVEPGMSGTAVIINEFGEASLDHLLVRDVAPDVVELPNGCLCCAVRQDLVTSLAELVQARDKREIPWFDRAVIETSGLADPAPILSTLSADPFLDALFTVSQVVTVVDPARIFTLMRDYPEAQAQVVVADSLVLSRTDLAPVEGAALMRLAALNPVADLVHGIEAPSVAGLLFPDTKGSLGSARLPTAPVARHSHDVSSITLEIAGAPGRLDFAKTLCRLVQTRGDDILRIKGMLRFSDRPGRVAVIHAVQHTMFEPQWLDRWPDTDERARLVVIGRDLDLEEVIAALAGLGARAWQPAVAATAG